MKIKSERSDNVIKRDDKQIKIEGLDVFELVEKYDTPLYCYSEKVIAERIKIIHDVMNSLREFHLGFALKANNNIHLINYMVKNGTWIDIVNKNEYILAREGGTPPEKIVVNGNGKTKEFITEMIKEGVFSINIDSREEYELIREILREMDSPQNLPTFMLRVNPDVDPHTHPYISTGLKENKFGVQMDTALAILLSDNGLITGLHTHIGSNIYDISAYQEAFGTLLKLKRDFPRLNTINIGGGWGIDYKKNGVHLNLDAYTEKVIPILRQFDCPVMMEIGRFILGPAGVLLSKVLYKKVTEYKTFVVCDANMSNMIRPALYNAYHHVQPLHVNPSDDEITADIVGGLCETGDRIAVDRDIEDASSGDLLAIYDTGAYGYSMASNYNAESRPAEILISDDECRLIRKRETVDDLLKKMKV
ncbi:MAG: diaminopimelate decarboxylase [Thermotogota bacterium]|nr:diaminopimelate decarboxylase [Thermotogota bacterium]